MDPARRKQLALRIGFLAALGGGLWLWTKARMPHELPLLIDLTEARPGELQEADVVVTRAGHLLVRTERRFTRGDAPQKLLVEVKAPAGPAEVEATLVYAKEPARRVRATVELREEVPAVVGAK